MNRKTPTTQFIDWEAVLRCCSAFEITGTIMPVINNKSL